jgi:hypothetical protein
MNPRKDFNPFVPFDWYENYWLRPEPVKQSAGFRHLTGVMTMVHRATQFAVRGPAGVQRRDEAAADANQLLTSSVFHGARGHGRSGT